MSALCICPLHAYVWRVDPSLAWWYVHVSDLTSSPMPRCTHHSCVAIHLLFRRRIHLFFMRRTLAFIHHSCIALIHHSCVTLHLPFMFCIYFLFLSALVLFFMHHIHESFMSCLHLLFMRHTHSPFMYQPCSSEPP